MSADVVVHPAAAVFPMLPDDELRALAEDIAANGLLHPVVIDAQGQVIDGRNRLAACELAGVEPTYTTYDGDPAAYILGANVTRRHMTTGSRAMATAVVLASDGKRQNGRWMRGSVPANNAESRDSGGWAWAVRQAGVVLDVTPEVAPAVISGARALSAAHAEAVEAKQQAQSYDVRLVKLPDELATQVREGDLTLEGAEAEQRQRVENAERAAREIEQGREQMTMTVRKAIAILGNRSTAEWLPERLANLDLPIEPDEHAQAMAALARLAPPAAAPKVRRVK